MKKILKLSLLLMLVLFVVCSLVACNKNKVSKESVTTDIENFMKETECIKDVTVSEDGTISATVTSSTSSYDLEELGLTGTSYTVFSDEENTNEESGAVPLNYGENTFYVVVKSKKSSFTVKIVITREKEAQPTQPGDNDTPGDNTTPGDNNNPDNNDNPGTDPVDPEPTPAHDHVFGEWTTVTPATCTEKGVKERVCTVEGCNEKQTEDIDPIGHDYDEENIVWTWANDYSSCTATFTCKNDPTHKETVPATITVTEIGGEQVPQASVEVEGVTITRNPADDDPNYTPGTHHGGDPDPGEDPDPAHDHVFGEWTTVTPATCTEKGSKERVCTVEGCNEKQTEDIDPLGHDYPETNVEWSWNNDYSSCTATFVCSRVSTHTETVNATIRTSVSNGVRTYTATATAGNFTYTDSKQVDVVYTPTFTWNGYSMQTVVLNSEEGDDTQELQPEITEAVEEAPSCTTTGTRVYTATVVFNGKTYTDTKTEEIPVLNHDYGEVSYVWSNDNSTCTATRVCRRDSSHVETETVNSGSETTATCTEAGTRTYTAAFNNAAFSAQTKEIAEEALGHNFVNGVCTRCDQPQPITIGEKYDASEVLDKLEELAYSDGILVCYDDGHESVDCLYWKGNVFFYQKVEEVYAVFVIGEESIARYDLVEGNTAEYSYIDSPCEFTRNYTDLRSAFEDLNIYTIMTAFGDYSDEIMAYTTEQYHVTYYDDEYYVDADKYTSQGVTILFDQATGLLLSIEDSEITEYCYMLATYVIPDDEIYFVAPIQNQNQGGEDPEGPEELDDGPIEKNEDGFYYKLKQNDTYELVRYAGGESELVVPSSFNGKAVTSFGESAFANTYVLFLTIPESVTSIDMGAFYECENILHVRNLSQVPMNSVFDFMISNEMIFYMQEYYEYFAAEAEAEGVTINEYLNETLGEYYGITVDPDEEITLEYLARLMYTMEIEYFEYYDLYEVVTGNDAFTNTLTHDENGLWLYSVNDKVYWVGYDGTASTLDLSAYNITDLFQYVLSDNYTVNSIILPATLKNIGPYAFSDCYVLKSVSLPVGLETIGSDAFYRCTSLTTVNLPSTLEKIGPRAFSWCWSLEEIVIPEGITEIEESTFFYCTNLKSVTLPVSLTDIRTMAFSDCEHLYSIIVPENVETIEDGAFSCPGLVEIYNGSSLEIIPGTSENGSIALYAKAVYTATDTSKIINENNFIIYVDDESGNRILLGYEGDDYDVIIPSNVVLNEIPSGNGYSAVFPLERNVITNVRFPESFENTSSYTELVGKHVVNIYINYSGSKCSIYNNVYSGAVKQSYEEKFDAPVSHISKTEDGYIIYNDGYNKVLIAYVGDENELTLPSGITEIYQYAFYQNAEIVSVTIPNTVTRIGGYAFSSCYGLRSITIPSSVTHIDEGAFYGCYNLKTISVSNNLTHLGNSAFADLHKLIYNEYNNGYYIGNDINPYLIFVKVKNIGATSITLHKDTKFVHTYAFTSCENLKNVVIPEGVISIGSGAFGQYVNLTSLTLPASLETIGALSELKYPYYHGHGYNSARFANTIENLYYTGDLYYWCNIDFAYPESNPLFFTNNFYVNGELTTEIVIPSLITDIKANTFAGYKGKSITIHNDVTNIGNNAFTGCSAEIIWGDHPAITELTYYAFERYSGTDIVIPDSIETISSGAFFFCENLENVHYYGTVNSWCSIMFDDCGSNPLYSAHNLYINDSLVTNLTISDVEYIHSCSFAGASCLQTLKINHGVKEIGYRAFYQCTELTEVWLPTGLTSLGFNAFDGCENLTDVYYAGSESSWNSLVESSYIVFSEEVTIHFNA